MKTLKASPEKFGEALSKLLAKSFFPGIVGYWLEYKQFPNITRVESKNLFYTYVLLESTIVSVAIEFSSICGSNKTMVLDSFWDSLSTSLARRYPEAWSKETAVTFEDTRKRFYPEMREMLISPPYSFYGVARVLISIALPGHNMDEDPEISILPMGDIAIMLTRHFQCSFPDKSNFIKDLIKKNEWE